MIRQGLSCSYSRITLACCLVIQFPWAGADGVSDLRTTVTQLQPAASIPIVLDVEFKLFGRSGDHDGLVDREGVINLWLEDDKQGMRIGYPADTIALLHSEELAKIDDENVKNSALNAIGQFEYWEWREVLYPAAQLELMLKRYTFISEKNDVLNGMPVRLLTFRMPLDKVDKSYRKYIKKYENHFQLWIDDKGIPLASQIIETGAGRVFIVVGFKFKNETHTRYQMHGHRLLAIRREVKEESSGATMQSQRHFITTVTAVNKLANQK